ncbi:MAG: hypothetical protein KKE02_19695 [Alphaproteobacteria bacterium]|nr:hypothetical protein [Alphaproteobacteria bacterium]MBU1516612.1 hypothetical protein [Alphaproteobacteria bacterium]MBU2094368.1 hypothetical protein [Alphaproteobacteria bacterium]MBU2153253.1 hypothetical protein [Alphaproteobacteria bacterium]MBU2307539.1 hypothetical protein [Alphaproteobacteria bacterium]
MESLSSRAIGTANLMMTNRKLDLTQLDPRLLKDRTDLAPTPAADPTDAEPPLAQALRTQFLDGLGLSEDDVDRMREEARFDLEQEISRHVHREALAHPTAPTGSLVDLQA